MTERKPVGVSWQTWIDRQIAVAREQGDFDDLPGAGKPLAGIERPRDELWWVRDKLRREGVEYLPPALAIRKEAVETLRKARSATTRQEARRIVEELNAKIRHLNSHTIDGPPTTLMPFDVDEVLADWRPDPPPRPIETSPPAPTPAPETRSTLRSWLRRR